MECCKSSLRDDASDEYFDMGVETDDRTSQIFQTISEMIRTAQEQLMASGNVRD